MFSTKLNIGVLFFIFWFKEWKSSLGAEWASGLTLRCHDRGFHFSFHSSKE